MRYKPDEKDWMAWLYGEMDDADKARFDAYVAAHPEARLEMDKYVHLRSLMARAEDKEVIAPPVFIGDRSADAPGRRRSTWHAPYFRTITSIAASLLILLLAGKFSGAQLSVSDREFRLTFGKTPPDEQPEPKPLAAALSPQQVQEMINTSLEKNNAVVQQGLAETREKLEGSIRRNLAVSSGRMNQLVQEASSASQEQIRAYVEDIRSENMQQVKDYFQLTTTEQKKYIENLLVDFSKYLQQQRNNDLQLVQTRMNSLEQNTDIFKQETEQILSSIITTVGNPGSREIKN